MRTFILLCAVVLWCTQSCTAQDWIDRSYMMQSTPSVYRGNYTEYLKKYSPVLYEREQKLLEVQKEIQGIVKEYRDKRIDREEAKEKIKPLLKQQVDLQTNQDYQIEQMLLELLSEPAASTRQP